MSTDWEKRLWEELGELPEEEQIVRAGEWIVGITRDLLPALGNLRRDTVLKVLARPNWDATRLAEMIGSRRTTITRLAEEGRKRHREADAQ